MGQVEELRVVGSILILVVIGTAGGRPPECSFSVESESMTGGGGKGVYAKCNVRKLTPELFELGNDNLSLPLLSSANYVTAMTLLCSHQVVFQSEIRPGFLAELPRLENLSLVGCKILWLPSDSFSNVLNLKYLSIKGNLEEWPGKSLEFDPHAFINLNRLERLDLTHNAVWSVPASTLCQLPSLTALNVTFNHLHHLSDLGIGRHQSCSHPLLELDLGHNQLDEVPNEALANIQDLRFISLANNRIVRLSDLAFSGLSELKHLDVSHNKLVAIPRSAFADLTQLTLMNLSNNSILDLPPRAFSSLAQLLTLNLSSNQLNFEIDSTDLFEGLIRLVVLDISQNDIEFLGPNLFNSLYSLQVLHLENNQIKYIVNNTFMKLTNLHTLQLSYNMLATLSGSAFKGLAVLTYLHLDNNQISSIKSTTFDNCSSLNVLNLSSNKLAKTPESITHISLLKVLDLSYNNIELLDKKDFQGLTNLQMLHLHHNSINDISNSTFNNLPSLTQLDISNNQISSIKHDILNVLSHLEGLNVSYNFLSDVNGLVNSLEHLQWLNVSNNQLNWFDYALIPPGLVWVDVSENQISKLGNHYELQNQHSLKRLYASNNNITIINSFSVLDTIVELYLQNNVIEYIASNTFVDKHKMSMIDLRNNNLVLIEESSLRTSPQKKKGSKTMLLLSNNPLDCDCGADWFTKVADDRMRNYNDNLQLPHIGDLSDVRCRLPGLWQHASVPLMAVQPHQFLCTYRRHCFTLCHCCEFDACDCEQTCPRNCTCYHDHTWTHNIVDCGDGGWSNIPSGVPMDVTEAFMDGNDIGALSSHAMIGRKNLKILSLNNSEVITIQNSTFNGLRNLEVLRLDHNKLTSFQGYEFVHLHNLLELHLDHNKLQFLSNITFTPLRKLEVLTLNDNKLSLYPVWNLAINPFLIEVTLYNNLWSCECNYLANLRAWLEANRIKNRNATLVKCYHNSTGEMGPPVLSEAQIRCDPYVTTPKINKLIVQDYVMLATISSTLLMLILIGALLAVAYRRRLKLWAISRYGKRLFDKSSSYVEERQKLFDAFVSHSAKDSTWVCGLLSAELEARGYRLCVVHRDCALPSAPVVSQAITESIICSHRVLLVLSRNLVDSEWCRYDFKSPHVEALHTLRRGQLIVIVLEDVPRSEIDPDLAALLKSAAVTLYPRDPRFWDRLRRALPSLRHRRKNSEGDTLNKAVSRPLVTPEIQNGMTWSMPETTSKTIGHMTTKSLTVNPYWENAVTTTLSDHPWAFPDKSEAAFSSTWLANPVVKDPPTLSRGDPREVDHMYMSVSECGDVQPPEQLPLGSIPMMPGGTTSSSSDIPSPSRPLLQHCIGSTATKQPQGEVIQHPGTQPFRRGDVSDYQTRSWIFHPPPDQPTPPPGQTYFV